VVEFKQVPSLPKFRVSADGDVVGPSGRVLRHFPNKRGYRRVNLYLGERRWKQVSVHTLVCEAFHGPRPAGAVLVAHADGDPSNNRADNLRWATHRENEADKRRHGRAMLGEGHHRAVLTEAQVREIRARRAAGEQGVRLAREFGVTPTTICNVHQRKTWGHLS
jgi:hypothetical protein